MQWEFESRLSNITRRMFSAASAAALVNPAPAMQAGPRWTTPGKKMIGIQVGAVSFVDEGVEPVLDNVQKFGGVNTLFVATFTYGRGIAGRQVPGQPLPDHGKQEYDTDFRGGNYTKINPQYYRSTFSRISAQRTMAISTS